MILMMILMMILPYTVYALAGQERWLLFCSFSSCRQGALVVAFYARADQELGLSPFMLVRTRSVVPCSLGSCRRGVLMDLSNDLGEAFLAISIARSLDRMIEEVFGEEIAHRDGNGRSSCRNFIILNTFM